MLTEKLYEYASNGIGKPILCPCLRSKIYIKSKFIRETIHHASKSDQSTKIALHMIKFIKSARFEKLTEPKKNKNQKGFSSVIILKSEINKIGKAKIVIGIEKIDNNKDFYCITAFKEE